MLDGQDLERELTRALSVSPSADFEARVLQRVEARRQPQWPAGYRWLAAAASIVIVAATFYALNRAPAALPSAAVTTVLGPPVPGESARPLTVPAETPKTGPRMVAARRPRTTVTPAISRSGEPEVLVPPGQMDAIRRLVRGVNEGRIVAPAEPGDVLSAPPASLVIAPLVIDPIPVPPLETGGETRKPSTRNSL